MLCRKLIPQGIAGPGLAIKSLIAASTCCSVQTAGAEKGQITGAGRASNQHNRSDALDHGTGHISCAGFVIGTERCAAEVFRPDSRVCCHSRRHDMAEKTIFMIFFGWRAIFCPDRSCGL